MPSSKPTKIHWDPWLILSQVISMQAIHYLTLCFIIPPLLGIFAEQTSLAYEVLTKSSGGAANVGFVMDWREMCSRPTIRGLQGRSQLGWTSFTGAYSSGKKIGFDALKNQTLVHMSEGRIDPRRGWCIAIAWLVACMIDVFYLFLFIRRPRLILDFVLTFVLNHVILTAYYSAALPSAIFFWVIVLGGAFITITLAEQLCVKRELEEGLAVGGVIADSEASGGRSLELMALSNN
ncbi:hypothetical protein Clacol_005762 [Clathrus columnatus]|uniref:Integral membrane protein S linking to the trans Golgi network-domain-containing protein n=1 Tax=Clathrus columnatus TaxID=1419009 RepID=A0AAV5AFR4_9AGAM|nr:hypothetical protein Clacol_005762 [Clathrus columnatus]